MSMPMARCNHRTAPAHRGVSLVEMLAAITVGSVLLALATSLIGLLLRVEKTSRQHVLQTATLHRLSAQFRKDVRAAIDQQPQEDVEQEVIARLILPEQIEVEYQIQHGNLVRLEQRAGTILRRESYQLPPRCEIAITTNQAIEPNIVSLRVEHATDKPTGPVYRIDAALAANARFHEEE